MSLILNWSNSTLVSPIDFFGYFNIGWRDEGGSLDFSHFSQFMVHARLVEPVEYVREFVV